MSIPRGGIAWGLVCVLGCSRWGYEPVDDTGEAASSSGTARSTSSEDLGQSATQSSAFAESSTLADDKSATPPVGSVPGPPSPLDDTGRTDGGAVSSPDADLEQSLEGAESTPSLDAAVNAESQTDAGDAGGEDPPPPLCLPVAGDDATCDGVDDDCDGQTDEDYVATASSCGVGVCQAPGQLQCVSGVVFDTCVPGAPASAQDDAAGPGNGLDDNCNGVVDEDVPCDTAPRVFGPGSYADLAVPVNCTELRVQLWGGGGGGGQAEGAKPGGRGGGGGYAESSLSITGALTLHIGEGGAASCDAGGVNVGSAQLSGGAGRLGDGEPGADGVVAGGGTGATPSSANVGGQGHYGGGGGGAGDPILGLRGRGGGGGAASALLVNSTLQVVAGGGGGGGGAATITLFGVQGGDGGQGCGGNGAEASSSGGGGGGGGVCVGAATELASSGVPFDAGALPSGQAAGGASSCQAGGGGYAIVTFSQ